MTEQENIKFKRGDIISSEKYEFRRVITKVLTATDELKLINEGEDESLTDGYTFGIPLTIKNINSGIYVHEKRKATLPTSKK